MTLVLVYVYMYVLRLDWLLLMGHWYCYYSAMVQEVILPCCVFSYLESYSYDHLTLIQNGIFRESFRSLNHHYFC